MATYEGVERRRWFRVAARGSAVVHAGRPVRGRIVDLSGSGVRISLGGADGLRVGAPVDLELHLDGFDASWVPLRGRVMRIGREHDLAVRFDLVSADFEDQVEDEILADVESERVAHVLLVDPDPARRRPLADALRRNGCDVVELATPLEVIARVGESRTHAWLIAIAETIPESVAEELREYLAGGSTRAELVVVGAALPSPDLRPHRRGY